MTNKRSKLGLAVIGIIFTSQIHAAEPWRYKDRYAFPVGEAGAYYDVDVEYGNDSNVRRQDAANETDSSYFRLKPHADLIATSGASHVSLEYKGDYRLYQDDSDVDSIDHQVALTGKLVSSSKQSITGQLFYNHRHQEIGTGLSLGRQGSEQLTEVDYIDDVGFGLKYRLGSYASKGLLDLEARLTNRTYDAGDVGREISAQESDRSEAFLRTQFSYRITAKTRALARLDYIDYDYDTATNEGERDRTDINYGVGLGMRLSQNADSTFVIGSTQTEYDAVAFQDSDYDGSYLDTRITWDVTERSRILLRGRKSGGSADGSTSVSRDEEYYRLNWRHDWTPKITSHVELYTYTRSYVDTALDYTIDRQVLGIDYNLRRYLAMGVRLARHERSDSNEYERDELGLTLTFKP